MRRSYWVAPQELIAKAVLAVAICVGTTCFSARVMGEETAEQIAVKSLRGMSTNIQLNKDGSVRLVRLSKAIVADEHMVHLAAFSKIDYLAVVCPKVTDAGITHIRQLTNLDSLMLSGSGLTDTGMSSLSNLTKLERLYLADTRITSKGLVHLSKLTKLHTLSLNGTSIDDSGIAQLSHLAELDTLFLCDTAISDDGLQHLLALKKLRTLYLTKTRVTGAGLTCLRKLVKLENLTLTDTAIDDSAIGALAELTKLKQLTLYRTKLSGEGIDGLRKKLPKTGVNFSHANLQEPIASQTGATEKPKLKQPAMQPILKPAKSRFVTSTEVPNFQRHVIPLFGRLGCNGRSCHGSFQGQGGFRLSMFGYDFDMDLENLTKGEHPRVDVKRPASSLILNKPTSEDNHEGGLRYEKNGWEYKLLHRWIESGAKGVGKNSAKFVQLDVTPRELVFRSDGETTQLKAIAVWSDGTREDVTCLTRFETKDDGVAEVTPNGLVRSKGPGSTYIISLYDNGIASTQVLHPMSQFIGEKFPDVSTPTRIDELVVEKLSKLGIVPSDLSTDAEFLRRVSLDMIGTQPTPKQIAQFVADASTDKRQRKIDELLEHPAYITWWTTKLCDLTGSNAGYLGGTEMAQPVAKQWRDWIERRVRENVGFDKIVKGIVLATSRKPGQPYEEFIAELSRYTSRQNPTDFAALDNSMPYYWYRDNMRQPKEKALAFGYTFLGIRLQCAECHKHPYDQWSKQDFQLFTQYFARIRTGVAPDAAESFAQMRGMLAVPVKLNTAALRRQSYMRIAAEGRSIPWGEVYVSSPNIAKKEPAKLLGGEEVDLSRVDDPRRPLMDWLLNRENPYFARAFVNRIWANYFGVGIIDPPDDLNMANPPSNKALLEHLERGFVDNGYDMKWLHRTIANSRTYQLSWKPNDSNRRDDRNFSHAIIRRLPAEVIVDAIIQSTANDKAMAQLNTSVTRRKIGQHPKSFQTRSIDYSLLIFGKPLRTTNCDCERQSEPTLVQALYIRNDKELLELLDRKDGWLSQLSQELKRTKDSAKKAKGSSTSEEERVNKHLVASSKIDQLIRTAYLRTLSREPLQLEIAECRKHVRESSDTIEGLTDVMWALLNTQEFITNH